MLERCLNDQFGVKKVSYLLREAGFPLGFGPMGDSPPGGTHIFSWIWMYMDGF